MKNIQVGDPAPDFLASDPLLADCTGKKALVLFFYPADEALKVLRQLDESD